MRRGHILPMRFKSDLAITTANPLVSGTQGTAYSVSFAATGGVGTYSWFLLHDYAGTGLTMSTGGVLSGVPNTSGLAQFVVAVTEPGGQSVQGAFYTTFASAVGLSITNASPLPGATVGSHYSNTLTAVGGTAPYTWSILSDTPNTGGWLSISAAGVLSGTPGAAETESLTVQVRDNLGTTVSKAFTLTVSNATRSVGVNLNRISYFNPEQPFLNVMKQAASNNAISPWFTSNGGTADTHEQAFIQIDSNGYPTSLTANPIPGGGQLFTFLQTFINFSLNGGVLPPGAAALYPPDTYRFQWEGTGTLNFAGDVQSLTGASAGCTITGTQVASINPWGTTNTVTVCGAAGGAIAPTSGGMKVQITAIPDPLNYPKSFSLVQSTYASNLDAGEILHPLFKASLLPYNRARFMDWRVTNGHDFKVTFNANLALNATSGTFSTLFTKDGGTFTTWPLNSGTYTFVFQTGQVIQVNCVAGSANVTWATPLSAAIATTAVGGMAYWALEGSWNSRPKYTSVSWSGCYGVPFEACMALCNELAIDCWLNIPATSHVAAGGTAYATSLAQLALNGTGTTLPGFTGLSASQKLYVEYSNETWNGAFTQNGFTIMLGFAKYSATQNQFASGEEWKGLQTANIADAFFAVYGSSAFNNQVIVVMGGQFAVGNGQAFMKLAMNTPDESTAAYTHHIGIMSFAPYFGTNAISAADATTIVALGDPVTTMFGLAYSNTVAGNTYASLPAAGYLGNVISTIASMMSGFVGQPWASFPVASYEGGSDFVTASTPASGVAGWLTVLNNMHRDTRMQYLYYDPGSVLSANPGYLPALVTAGWPTVNQFNDCFPISQFGEWGALESTMQAITPKASSPPKFLGIRNYVGV